MTALRKWIEDWDEAGWEASITDERIPLRAYIAHWLAGFKWVWA